MDVKSIKKQKLKLEDAKNLYDEIRLLSKECDTCYEKELIIDLMNYSYLLYSKIEEIIKNTNYIEIGTQNTAELIYCDEFKALSYIIYCSIQLDYVNQKFQGKSIEEYIKVGLKLKDEILERYDSNKLDYGFLFSLFLETAKWYYELINNYKQATEMVYLLNKYCPKS